MRGIFGGKMIKKSGNVKIARKWNDGEVIILQ
jgi:hypothetical protein